MGGGGGHGVAGGVREDERRERKGRGEQWEKRKGRWDVEEGEGYQR